MSRKAHGVTPAGVHAAVPAPVPAGQRAVHPLIESGGPVVAAGRSVDYRGGRIVCDVAGTR